MAAEQHLIQHLFRTEYSKICSVLCRTFGLRHLDIAEDIAGETFLQALETWSYKGMPQNPVAWLYAVARNNARNYIKRSGMLPGILRLAETSSAVNFMPDIELSDQHIQDSQLQMLFAVCHPVLAKEAQVSLALRVLCGFGIDEIATAFMTNREVINKRLFRAKEKLRNENVTFGFPPSDQLPLRLAGVLTTLYLLFSEGYYSESSDMIVREELCSEALRLTDLLLHSSGTDLPEVNALYALMCFHSSRFAARKQTDTGMLRYDDQDDTLWDQLLISKGAFHLNKASQGAHLTKYHLEASIAYQYTISPDTQEKWENILHLYNLLLQVEYSSVAALNRTYALSKVRGKQAAITEAEKLHLQNNHFYFTLLGELYTGIDHSKAKAALKRAWALAKNATDRKTIEAMIERVQPSFGP